ncbi:MAG: hypothetical protein ACI9R3_000495 [Verrucomicrobiales bacterium]
MKACTSSLLSCLLSFSLSTQPVADAAPVEPIPAADSHWLNALSPKVLELGCIFAVGEKETNTRAWRFTDQLPPADAFDVIIDGVSLPDAVANVGFRRRPRYAPLEKWDLRVESAIYLQLKSPIAAEARVNVRIAEKWRPFKDASFATKLVPSRHSPVLHTSQAGYQIDAPKTARAGYYLGTIGELDLAGHSEFYLRDTTSGNIVFRGPAQACVEEGFTYTTPHSQQVKLLDFSQFNRAGTFTLGMNGIGESYPFTISHGYHACLARTYALGLYHQRCGYLVGLPFSRFQHAPCHNGAAKIPDAGDRVIWKRIKDIADNNHEDQTAPSLDSAVDALYPFRRKGEINVSGGHHDAGDYSKYVTNSAQLVHALTYAVDSFPGVSEIDNLGIPESGNGIPDALEIAACEAAFLAKMQDSDGGFYFLVYPRDRAYETDVTPENGDLQTVFPKNTAGTAAAAAALCQMASSPEFRQHFPLLADRYLRQAQIGWRFIMQAQKTHGEVGAYQTISHYGDLFMDRDEIIWLATELYLATGEEPYHQFLLRKFSPGSADTAHWGWLKMQDGFGAAARSYAAAEKSGRLKKSKLHADHLRACHNAIEEWAEQLTTYTAGSAYGVAFPFESKRHRGVGWHFATANMFHLVSAMDDHGQIPPPVTAAIASNLAYETGANAVNVCHLTGLGFKRQFEVVHQWGLNDREQLPLTGIPLGSLQSGFRWNHRYEAREGSLVHPSDGDQDAPYPFYHRWADGYNLSTEFTISQQGNALAAMLGLMAQSRVRDEKWSAPVAAIVKSAEGFTLTLPEPNNLNLDDALVIWEAKHLSIPHTGTTLPLTDRATGWISVEAQWPDGKRAAAILDTP